MEVEREIVFPGVARRGLGGADGAGAARGVVRDGGRARRAARRRGRLPLGRRRRAARGRPRARGGGAARARLGRRRTASSLELEEVDGGTRLRVVEIVARVRARRSSCARSRGGARSRVDRVFAALGDPGRRSLVEAVRDAWERDGDGARRRAARHAPGGREAAHDARGGGPAPRDARGPRDALRGDAGAARGRSRVDGRGRRGLGRAARRARAQPREEAVTHPCGGCHRDGSVTEERSTRQPPAARARSGSGRAGGCRGAARTPTRPGASRKPPHVVGRGTGSPSNSRSSSATRSSSSSRDGEQLALPRGVRAELRVARAGWRSTRPTRPRAARSTRPSTRTCRPSGVPVEEERGLRVRLELASLPARVVREEDEPALVEALQKHHPHRRSPVVSRRRERHRLRNLERLGRLVEPPPELLERVGGEILPAELGFRLHAQSFARSSAGRKIFPPSSSSEGRARGRPAGRAPPRR